MMRRIPVLATILVLAAAMAPCRAAAQSLGLAPAQIVQDFTPGVPFELELTTVNNGVAAVEMSVQITDFWYDEKNEKTFTAPGTSPHSAANWIQFVPEHFQVAPQGSQKMKAVVTPPSDAKGGYYAVLFVQSRPQLSFDKTPDGKQVFTNMRIGCLVMLTARKTEDYGIELSNPSLQPPSTSQDMQIAFELNNKSNTHIFPVPRVAVFDANRKLVAKAEGDPKRFLPGQKDSMHVTWSGSLPAGNYNAVLTVAWAEDRIETRELPFTVSE